jgi:hypothetical protein
MSSAALVYWWTHELHANWTLQQANQSLVQQLIFISDPLGAAMSETKNARP